MPKPCQNISEIFVTSAKPESSASEIAQMLWLGWRSWAWRKGSGKLKESYFLPNAAEFRCVPQYSSSFHAEILFFSGRCPTCFKKKNKVEQKVNCEQASKQDLSPWQSLYSTPGNWNLHFSLAANRKTELVAQRSIPKWDLLGPGQPLKPPRYATATALGGWRQNLLASKAQSQRRDWLISFPIRWMALSDL